MFHVKHLVARVQWAVGNVTSTAGAESGGRSITRSTAMEECFTWNTLPGVRPQALARVSGSTTSPAQSGIIPWHTADVLTQERMRMVVRWQAPPLEDQARDSFHGCRFRRHSPASIDVQSVPRSAPSAPWGTVLRLAADPTRSDQIDEMSRARVAPAPRHPDIDGRQVIR